MTQELDRKDLKIQALLEKVSNMTAQYEDQIADLRVELTVVSQELHQLKQAQEDGNADVPEEPQEETQKSTKRKN